MRIVDWANCHLVLKKIIFVDSNPSLAFLLFKAFMECLFKSAIVPVDGICFGTSRRGSHHVLTRKSMWEDIMKSSSKLRPQHQSKITISPPIFPLKLPNNNTRIAQWLSRQWYFTHGHTITIASYRPLDPPPHDSTSSPHLHHVHNSPKTKWSIDVIRLTFSTHPKHEGIILRWSLAL